MFLMFLYKRWTESLFTSLQILDEPNKCDLFWYFSRFALSFNKIGGTSEIKINVIYFGISLGLHYLCRTLVYNGVHFEEVK